jgi:hypothetical protein
MYQGPCGGGSRGFWALFGLAVLPGAALAADGPVLAAQGAVAALGAAVTGPAVVAPGPFANAHDVRGKVYDTVPPLNDTIQKRLIPQLDYLLQRVVQEGRGMRLDGVAVFDADDKFLPGKIALGLASVLLDTPRSDPQFATRLAAYRRMAEMTLEDDNHTWGIYYYAMALYKLQQAGLLERAVSPQALARLRTRLDWRHFVRESDLTLINLPNNYFGVAFGTARLRLLLGWEKDAGPSEALLTKVLENYRAYSGKYGFSDETDGDGRFDRYSVLLAAEIAQRCIDTGREVPPEVKQWLRKSVDVMLARLNPRGEGFEYGRSIGTYGETALLEVLSVAAKTGVLTEQEKEMAYAFCSRIAARYADFWLNPNTHSVNMWDEGRHTDAYRGKHRILGENLSLADQYLYTNAYWNSLGYQGRAPSTGFVHWLDTLPTHTVTWFARGDYDRLLVTVRDSGRVIGLPVINGGPTQHMNNPYFPVPFSPGMLQGSPDSTYPNLLPRFVLKDGTALMPLAFFKKADVRHEGARTIVTYEQDELDRMGEKAPVKDNRLRVTTEYVLEPGHITRTDRYVPASPLGIDHIVMEFGSYSSQPQLDPPATTVRFGSGDVYEFQVSGLDKCAAQAVAGADPYRTPVGPLQTRVLCTGTARELRGPLTVSWSLKYH